MNTEKGCSKKEGEFSLLKEFVDRLKAIKIEQGEMKGKTLWDLIVWHDIEEKFDRLAGEFSQSKSEEKKG